MATPERLSAHFTVGEFLHAGIRKVPAGVLANLRSLARALETARVRLGNRPITVTSGYRTARHNAAVGGAKNSFHLKGMAADIVVEGLSARQVQVILKDWPGGMGLAETFTHLDIRPYRVRFHYGA